jgi:transposase
MRDGKERRPIDYAEGRRLRAWELYEQGWTQAAIARALGVTTGAVCQWIKQGRGGGREALYHRKPPGRRARLTDEQGRELLAILARGAEGSGFRGDVWTTKRVAAVIAREFRVRYHPAHVSKLLRRLGWSVQRPVRRAAQRDERAIET